MIGAEDVLQVLACLDSEGVESWLDGGWGADALVGEQTREHGDLDVVVRLSDVDHALHGLATLGFEVSLDEVPTRCVLRDADDRRVDLHLVTFLEEGGAYQVAPEGGSYDYPAAAFAGHGRVDGHLVRCLAADVRAAGG